MDVHAADDHLGHVGREGLNVDQVAPLAVERVAGHGADGRRVEVVHAAADLLVAGETQPQRPVAEPRMFPEPGGHLHEDGHARLVVGPQQRRAVAGNQGPPLEAVQLGVLRTADHPRGVAGKDDVAARIALDHLRIDPRAAGFRRGVQVGAKGNDGGEPLPSPGIVARTMPYSSCRASAIPAAWSSSTSRRPNSTWPGELG